MIILLDTISISFECTVALDSTHLSLVTPTSLYLFLPYFLFLFFLELWFRKYSPDVWWSHAMWRHLSAVCFLQTKKYMQNLSSIDLQEPRVN